VTPERGEIRRGVGKEEEGDLKSAAVGEAKGGGGGGGGGGVGGEDGAAEEGEVGGAALFLPTGSISPKPSNNPYLLLLLLPTRPRSDLWPLRSRPIGYCTEGICLNSQRKDAKVLV
jgi:hypothetical protein